MVDLGDVILLPGLVNAHCHLDYTDMAGLLPPPKTFTDWLHLMISAKAQWRYAEYARSWLNGARMLLQTGTTTVADIEVVPDLLPEVWDATPLRVFSFLKLPAFAPGASRVSCSARPLKKLIRPHTRAAAPRSRRSALLHPARTASSQRP